MLIGLWFALAIAGVPDTVRPAPAPEELPAQFAAWARSKARTGEQLVCEALWRGSTVLCFEVIEGESRRWVTTRDLASWGIEPAAFFDSQRARATAEAAKVTLNPLRVEGIPGEYFEVDASARWHAAGLVAPEVLRERLKAETFLVVAPVAGVVLVWVPGDPRLDKVIAVGAREMFDAGDLGVSPVVHQRLPGRWAPFAEAKAKGKQP